MKKDFIYGVIAGCIAMLLLVGAVMAIPDEPNEPSVPTGTTQQTEGSTGALTTAPSVTTGPSIEPTEVTTAPSVTTGPSIEPTEVTTAPTEPSAKPTEAITQPTEMPTQPTEAPTQPTEAPTQPTEVPTQPTEPPTQPTEPPTQPTEQQATVLQIVTWPEEISGGEAGTVTIQGKPNTAYSIEVYYKSGPSSAKGLEEKVSDAEGFVTWTWKVSKNTKPGDFKIVVTGGGETVEVPFSVVE